MALQVHRPDVEVSVPKPVGGVLDSLHGAEHELGVEHVGQLPHGELEVVIRMPSPGCRTVAAPPSPASAHTIVITSARILID